MSVNNSVAILMSCSGGANDPVRNRWTSSVTGSQVAGPRMHVLTGQLHPRRPGDAIRHVPRAFHTPGIAAATDDERARPDVGQPVSDVELSLLLDVGQDGPWPFRQPRHRGEPRDRLLVIDVRGQRITHERTSPVVPVGRATHRLDGRFESGLGAPERFLRRTDLCRRDVEQHERGEALRVRRRGQQPDLTQIHRCEQGGLSSVRRVEHRDQVRDVALELRSLAGHEAVGAPPSARVIQDQREKDARRLRKRAWWLHIQFPSRLEHQGGR